MEKFFTAPRHIEVQVLADRFGNVLHLGERDCSLQRGIKKGFRRSPAIGISNEVKENIFNKCIEAVKKLIM
ncbi:MAG: hypothetical protein Ct9H300mP20_03500 [Gammaproteobacteria bacterium]|nr:MAG: hypothetical protein Ct9H300mP20_03500 [Gammaproteobacteria bacterium]